MSMQSLLPEAELVWFPTAPTSRSKSMLSDASKKNIPLDKSSENVFFINRTEKYSAVRAYCNESNVCCLANRDTMRLFSEDRLVIGRGVPYHSLHEPNMGFHLLRPMDF